MATSISGISAVSPTTQVTTVPFATAQAQMATTGEPQEDTVRISAAAQVKVLQTQGESISEIAANTGLSTEEINDYLGISAASQSTAVSSAVLRAVSQPSPGPTAKVAAPPR
jgi:hypothetical protein